MGFQWRDERQFFSADEKNRSLGMGGRLNEIIEKQMAYAMEMYGNGILVFFIPFSMLIKAFLQIKMKCRSEKSVFFCHWRWFY